MLPVIFRFVWPSCLRGEDFKSTNKNQELPIATLMNQNEMSICNRGTSIDASY